MFFGISFGINHGEISVFLEGHISAYKFLCLVGQQSGNRATKNENAIQRSLDVFSSKLFLFPFKREERIASI